MLSVTDTDIDVSYSDNSHIFGRPLFIKEGTDGFMEMPHKFHDEKRLELLGEWIEKVAFLEAAGIEMHLGYVKGEK